ncbi:mCG146864 [Mus musculus]|jgi:hypothetical protein|nr:mCG146864 [Mus musculus]
MGRRDNQSKGGSGDNGQGGVQMEGSTLSTGAADTAGLVHSQETLEHLLENAGNWMGCFLSL